MYVGIFVLSGFSIAFIMQRSKLIGAIVLVLIILSNLSSSYLGGRSIPGEPVVFRGDRVSKDQTEIISWLKARNISWIRTNYWIGYRLAFESNETIKFIVNQEPNQTRIEEWPKEAENLAVDQMPLVMVPAQARIIRDALALLNFKYEEEVVSGYHVFFNIIVPHPELTPIEPSNIVVSSDFNSAMATQAIDGSNQTRWGSGQHQIPGMQFVLTLKQPTILKGILYDLGNWPQDFPRALQIEFEKPNGERVLYFDSHGWESIRYLLEMRAAIPLYIKGEEVSKVIFTQTGKHAIFDWSIAEITLFR
jgi:hypothetical protein